MTISILSGIFLLAGIFGLGMLLALSILGSMSKLDSVSLALPLGIGVLSFSLFILSWAGVLLSWQVVTITLIALLLAGAANWFRSGLSGRPKSTGLGWKALDLRIPSILSQTPLAAFGLLVVLAVVIAVGIGYSTWDAIAIWSIKGYGIARTGSVVEAANWGAHRSAYPLNVSLVITSFRLIGGDLLPGSKAVFPLLWASTIVGIYSFWRKKNVGGLLSALGVLFLASIPVMFLHGTIGYANIPLASYIVLGAIWATIGITRADKGAQVVSGILLGLGAWTRVEGVLFSISIIVAVTLAWSISRQGRLFVAAWLAPFSVIAGIWLVYFALFGAEGSQAGGAMTLALNSFLNGDFGLGALSVIGRYFIGRTIEWRLWGLLFPVTLALIVASWRRLSPREYPVAFGLLLSTIATALATVLLYYIGSFFSPDLGGWLTRSFPRAFFQSAYLLGALAVLVASEPLSDRSEVTAGQILQA